MEPAPPALEGEVFTTEPPGKFPSLTYKTVLGGLLPCIAFGGKHDHNGHFWQAKQMFFSSHIYRVSSARLVRAFLMSWRSGAFAKQFGYITWFRSSGWMYKYAGRYHMAFCKSKKQGEVPGRGQRAAGRRGVGLRFEGVLVAGGRGEGHHRNVWPWGHEMSRQSLHKGTGCSMHSGSGPDTAWRSWILRQGPVGID